LRSYAKPIVGVCEAAMPPMMRAIESSVRCGQSSADDGTTLERACGQRAPRELPGGSLTDAHQARIAARRGGVDRKTPLDEQPLDDEGGPRDGFGYAGLDADDRTRALRERVRNARDRLGIAFDEHGVACRVHAADVDAR